jgi:hypothetical protein
VKLKTKKAKGKKPVPKLTALQTEVASLMRQFTQKASKKFRAPMPLPKGLPKGLPRGLPRVTPAPPSSVPSQSGIASAVVEDSHAVLTSDHHYIYRIYGAGLCSLSCLATLMGFSRIKTSTLQILGEDPTKNTYGPEIIVHTISPLYIIELFRELSIIKNETTIDKIKLISLFLGFRASEYDLRYYKNKLSQRLKGLINHIPKNASEERFREYISLFQVSITNSEFHKTERERNEFIKRHGLESMLNVMDGDFFMGEVISEYFNEKYGLEIGTAPLLSSMAPTIKSMRNYEPKKHYFELTESAQLELQLNTSLFKTQEGPLTAREKNENIQNTIYFLHSGDGDISRTTLTTTGHWDLVIPKKIHTIIENSKKPPVGASKNEKWVRAFNENYHLIQKDIIINNNDYKTEHWIWYVFPTKKPGDMDKEKITVDKESYTELFSAKANHIFFINIWADTLKKIAEIMDKDTSDGKDEWLKTPDDRGRIGYCYRLLEDWVKDSKFSGEHKKQYFFLNRIRFYLKYINQCVEKGKHAGTLRAMKQ